MEFKESTLKLYAAPLSDTENSKCKRAIEAIRDALMELNYTDDQKGVGLLESDTYSYSIAMRNKYTSEKIHIFIQGSYANNTCVRNESDVDIAVVREDKYEYAFGETFTTSTSDSENEASRLKDIIELVLRKKFSNQVHRGNKSIKVNGNTYRKQADVVPCLSMHYYYRSEFKDYLTYYDGIIIYADDGTITRNFPKQHIANGKEKNKRTNFYYKKMVRIMKKMRCLMSENGFACADKVSSFGLESLVWNVPDDYFKKYTCYGYAFEAVLYYLYSHKEELNNYYEANGIKKLFCSQQDIEKYKTFINYLYTFFDYDEKS